MVISPPEAVPKGDSENLAVHPQTACNHSGPGPPQDRRRPDTRTASETIGLHHQRTSGQTVRNHLSEAHLRAQSPHLALNLTAVRRRSDLSGQSVTPVRWDGFSQAISDLNLRFVNNI